MQFVVKIFVVAESCSIALPAGFEVVIIRHFLSESEVSARAPDMLLTLERVPKPMNIISHLCIGAGDIINGSRHAKSTLASKRVRRTNINHARHGNHARLHVVHNVLYPSMPLVAANVHGALFLPALAPNALTVPKATLETSCFLCQQHVRRE